MGRRVLLVIGRAERVVAPGLEGDKLAFRANQLLWNSTQVFQTYQGRFERVGLPLRMCGG